MSWGTEYGGDYFTRGEHIDVSTGAADAGKPIKLNADGHVDETMVPYRDRIGAWQVGSSQVGSGDYVS